MKQFRLQIIAADGEFFDGEVESVIVRTTVGDKGILAGHEPYVAALPIGKVKVKIDGNDRYAAISAGVIKVGKEKTTILAQSAEWADKIDIERAKAAKLKAESVLSSAKEGQRDFEIAEFKLKRAINRIDVAGFRNK